MTDKTHKFLWDVKLTIEQLESFMEGVSLESYQKNLEKQHATERCFEIIGEALNRIYRNDSELAESISDIHKIIGFRNIISHGYDILDEILVWKTYQDYLPKLKGEIQQLIDNR